MKSLDQPSRATLRNYGVRFGGYHIYFPALLKPAPRTLAVQLWMLKHGDGEAKGVDELAHLAASGRTSIPVDTGVAKSLYRTVGYRVCGGRAVRVDILERLADLIRPALAWRPNSPAPRPAGALDGSGFVVTGSMTSLVGSSGEDFASILRSLGYRMETRPKPPERVPVQPATSVDAGTSAGAAGEPATGDAAVDQETPDGAAVAEQSATTLAPDGDTATEPVETAAIGEEAPAEVEAPQESVPEAPAEATPVTDAAASAPRVEAPLAADSADSPAEAATPEAADAPPAMIEVWRPGRMDRGPDQRRKRHQGARDQRRGASPPQQGLPAQPQEPGQVQVAQAGDARTNEIPGRGREQRGEQRPERGGGRDGQERRKSQGGHSRSGQPHSGQPHSGQPHSGQPHSGKPPRRRDERRPNVRSEGDRQPPPRREPREKLPDPNSPFAKLLALKEQLESAKDRR
jgi:ATP-dependent RNA helicase SUPV3L1/SUV3